MRVLPATWQFAILSRPFGGPFAARSLGVAVGHGCRIYSMDIASERWLVSIGDRVTVSVGVRFITHDGTGWLARDDAGGRRYRYAPITVGDDCFIGAGATLMPGVQVQNKVVIAAGSVVTKSIPSGFVVGGNPARIIGKTSDLLEKISKTWRSEHSMQGSRYRERVESALDSQMKPMMLVPDQLRD